MYYTLAGQSSLFYRYFTPENDIIGALRYTSSGSVADVSFAGVNGMFVAGSKLYWSDAADGTLRRADWSSALGAPAAGTAETVSGPAIDGRDWRAHALYLYQSANGTAPNQPPTAQIGVTCDDLDCTYSSAASTDTDGTITSHAWTFGDGGTSTLANPTHHYAAAGTYTVGLTVTDNDGATGQRTQSIQVTHVNSPPTAAFSVTCTGLTCAVNGSASSDPNGPIGSYAWTFGDGGTATGATASHTYGGAGTFTIGLTVNDGDGGTDSTSHQVTVAANTPVQYVGGSNVNANANSFTVTVPAAVQAGNSLLLFFANNDPAQAITPPAGWTQLQTISSTNQIGRAWHKVATAADAGSAVKVTTSGFSKADLTLLAYSGSSVTSPVAGSSAASETVVRTTHTAPAVTATAGARVVSYWNEKSSATTAMTAPAGSTARASSTGTLAGRVTALAADSGPHPAGSVPGGTATADTASARALMFSVALTPAP